MTNDRLARGASELLVLGAAGTVAALFVPWEAAGDVIYMRPEMNGIDVGWGLVVAGIGVGTLVLALPQDWRDVAWLAVAAGVAILGARFLFLPVTGIAATDPSQGRLSLVVVQFATDGVSVPVLVDFAGLTFVAAGAIGAVAVTDRSLPRPLAGIGLGDRPVTRRALAGLAFGGTVLVLGSIGAAMFLANPDPRGGLHMWLTIAYPSLFALLATARAWSRPIALAAMPAGAVFAGIVLWTHATSGGGFPSAFSAFPFGGLLTLVGGLALLVAGVLTLGGAGAEPPDDRDRSSSADAGTVTSGRARRG